MEAEGGASSVRLPSLAFAVGAALKLDVQEAGPESASSHGVVCGELHESQGQCHATHDSRQTTLIGVSPIDPET
jgi:hypothetical protein